MKAVIKDVRKEVHPRLTEEELNHTPVVVVEVDYVDDAGKVVHKANHSFLPEQIDKDTHTLFDRQAEIMQRDVEDRERREKAAALVTAEHAPADEKVDLLRKQFSLEFSEKIPLEDKYRG